MKLSILVLEDDEALTRMTTEQIKHFCDAHVTVVNTVEKALAAIECVTYDGALLDLVLPDGSGLMVAEKCAQHNIPVVFTTGLSDGYNELLMLELGWTLQKPVSLTGMKRALHYFEEVKK